MMNIIFSVYAASRDTEGGTHHKTKRTATWRSQRDKTVTGESHMVYVFSHMETLGLNTWIYNRKAAEGLCEGK